MNDIYLLNVIFNVKKKITSVQKKFRAAFDASNVV